jgi:hypothetical protein
LSRRVPQKIAKDIDLIRWLYWQTLRRLSKYRLSTSKLLCAWRTARNRQPPPGWPAIGFQNTFRSADTLLTAYTTLRHLSTRGGSPKILESELTEVVDDALRRLHRLPTGTTTESRQSKIDPHHDLRAALKQFTETWGLKFPVPPNVQIPLEELLIADWCRPVRIVDSTPGRALRLSLFPDVGSEILFAFVKGGLKHGGNPKRTKGNKMLYRTVSRKRNPNPLVEIAPDPSSGRLIVTLGLPADIQNVLKSLRPHLPRSIASWRNREHYEKVFMIQDALRRREPRKRRREVALRVLGIRGPEGAITVRDLEKTFKNLAHKFQLPSA